MKNSKSKTKPVNKGDRVQVSIESLAGGGGDGVGSLDGYRVFVVGAAPGDRLEVEIVEAKKTYARARIQKILEPGPTRVKPPCPIAESCGGCSWMHLDYGAQLAAKTTILNSALTRIGGLEDLKPGPMINAVNPLNFRNKALVPVRRGKDGEAVVGFFGEGSHEVVSMPDEGCRVQSKSTNEVLQFVRARLKEKDWSPYEEPPGKGILRHLLLRDNSQGDVMLGLITTRPLPKELADEAASWVKSCGPLKTVLNNVQPDSGNVILGGETVSLSGPERLEEELGQWRFTLSAESFFQVNREQTPRLWKGIERARQWTGMENVMELYCGAGTLSLPISALAGKVWGFESVRAAVEDARVNAARNQRTNLRFEKVDAERAFQFMWDEGIEPDLVLVDPPRKGLSDSVVASLLTYQPREIIYVSCDPSTLARDLGRLVGGGYRVKTVEPFDLFPQTWHVESVTALELVEEA